MTDKPNRVGVALGQLDAVIAGPDGEIPVDAIVSDEARRMRELHRAYGDDRFKAAAKALEPSAPHRPAEGDDVLLHRIFAMLQRDMATDEGNAIRQLAREVSESDAFHAATKQYVYERTVKRLRRKYPGFSASQNRPRR